MTTWTSNLHLSTAGGEQERILRNSEEAFDDCTHIHKATFAGKLAWARRVKDLLRDDHDMLPEKVVDDHVGDDPQNEGIDEKELMPKNESRNESGYRGPTLDDIRHSIREALEKHAKRG